MRSLMELAGQARRDGVPFAYQVEIGEGGSEVAILIAREGHETLVREP
jgi:hypothetical protein